MLSLVLLMLCMKGIKNAQALFTLKTAILLLIIQKKRKCIKAPLCFDCRGSNKVPVNAFVTVHRPGSNIE